MLSHKVDKFGIKKIVATHPFMSLMNRGKKAFTTLSVVQNSPLRCHYFTRKRKSRLDVDTDKICIHF